MLFRIRRDRQPDSRVLRLRVTLFLIGAGVWMAGVTVQRPWITGAAIVILLPAVLLGLVGRHKES
jgi:hypothetical protein